MSLPYLYLRLIIFIIYSFAITVLPIKAVNIADDTNSSKLIDISSYKIGLSLLPGFSINKFSLEWRGSLVLTSKNKHFGGFSGIAVANGGSELLMLSDRGKLIKAKIIYNSDKRISTLKEARMFTLTDITGKVLNSNFHKDAEALTIDKDEDGDLQITVGFERNVRLASYKITDDNLSGAFFLKTFTEVSKSAPFNKELEAIGRVGKGNKYSGNVVVIAERNLDNKGNIRGWLLSEDYKKYKSFSVKRFERFDISDLTILPNGDLITLERRINYLSLPEMAIRYFTIDDIINGEKGILLMRASLPKYNIDNMEGISSHYDEKSQELRLTIISDDNFSKLQRTILMQFAISEKLLNELNIYIINKKGL